MGGSAGMGTKKDMEEAVAKVDLATLKEFAPFFVINAYIGRGVRERLERYDEQGDDLLKRSKHRDFDSLARAQNDELIKIVAKSALLVMLKDVIELALLHPGPAENLKSFQVMAYALFMHHDDDKFTPAQTRLRQQGHDDMGRDFREKKKNGRDPLTAAQVFGVIDRVLAGIEAHFDECFPAAAVACELARKWGLSGTGFEEKIQGIFREVAPEDMREMRDIVAGVRRKSAEQEFSALVAAFQESGPERTPKAQVSPLASFRPGGLR